MLDFTSRLFKAYKTLIELIEWQDFSVSQVKQNSIIHVEEMYQNGLLNALFEKPDGSGEKLYLFFSLETNMREGGLEEILDHVYIDEHFLENEDILVIVIKEELNDTMQETIRKKQKFEWLKNGRLIIIFSLLRLQINILKHEMVPKHTILRSEQEVQVLRQHYNITEDSKFPEISRFDPVAQSIFMKPGQICSIERISKTAIKANYYRCCLNL
jgi:DNA-directed RNA polymerases I, II, and III subunit RPABC1